MPILHTGPVQGLVCELQWPQTLEWLQMGLLGLTYSLVRQTPLAKRLECRIQFLCLNCRYDLEKGRAGKEAVWLWKQMALYKPASARQNLTAGIKSVSGSLKEVCSHLVGRKSAVGNTAGD